MSAGETSSGRGCEYVEYLKERYRENSAWLIEHRDWARRFAIAGRVLDAGSGFGHLAMACLETGAQVIGVERDWALVVEAAAVTGFQQSVCGDVTRLPFGESQFDWVLSNQVIEHLNDPLEFLRETARVLRPGGRLFLTTPNRRSHFATRRPTHLWAAIRGRAKSDPTHVHEFVPSELMELLESAGFVVVHREAVGRLSRRAWTRFFAGGVLLVARLPAP
jgi:2-polyprenyl-3-methyl-5-hydroxy-6-metoxy-1,4-benzoquinol methylase